MAAFSIHRDTLSLFLFIFLANPTFSLPSQTLIGNPNFDPQVVLFGDAKPANGDSHVVLTSPDDSSSGLIVLKDPFKFMEGNLTKGVSFSTEFLFSISAGNGDGLAFVVVPYDFPSRFVGQGSFGLMGENRFLGIEFDTKIDGNVGDLNANHIGVDVDTLESVWIRNISSLNLVLNNGETLKCWIDYDSSSKRLEVRLSRSGDKRPYKPILAYHIDLLEMWGGEDVLVGIVSTNGDSLQSTSVYSWRFRLRKVSSWMHSLPANPHDYVNTDGEDPGVHKRSFCALTILAGVIFATGCGALVAFVGLFMWAIFVSRHTVFPVEYQKGSTDFRYEKIKVTVEDTEGDKN
ncbi:hypothetical protein SLE2022_071220 [Rubroshorea leprosula]